MSMFPPELWLDLERDRRRELAKRTHAVQGRPRGRSPAAGVRARVAAAVRVLLARSDTVAEIHHLVVARAGPQRERDCA
jgi:hypothetical protein